MEINYYFRPRTAGNFSIERIFESISKELVSEANFSFHLAERQIDVRSIWTVRTLPADVHHITGAVNYLAFGLPPDRTILTVHDIGFYENPVNAGLKKYIYGLFWMKWPLRKVKVITTVSAFTRDRLVERFSVDRNKIEVVPNPVGPEFKYCEATPIEDKIRVLQIGSGDHKNLKSLIMAVRDLPVHLMIVGTPSTEEMRLISQHRISYQLFFDVSQQELLTLYCSCHILFFASKYEGFGVPIIEAQTVGRPVITSNFGAMKEVVRDSACLVSPENTEEIRDSIITLMSNSATYNWFVQKGISNAKRFELKSIARMYLALYKRMNGGD